MAKEKSKEKKQKKKRDIDELQKDYETALEMLKAKQERLNGLIREAKLYLQEIKELRDGLAVNKTDLDE